jgi:Secretion system C-terminal sorting domain
LSIKTAGATTDSLIIDDACLVKTSGAITPNLKVSLISQPQPTQNQQVALQYLVEAEFVDVNTAFDVKIYKSLTQTLDGSPALYTKSFASRSILANNSEWAFVPSTPFGYYIVVVDPVSTGSPNGTVVETRESDNIVASSNAMRVLPETETDHNSTLPEHAILVYPNPASRHFIVSLDDYSEKEVHIELLDMFGRVQKDQFGTFPDQVMFDVTDMTPGIYFVRVLGKGIRPKTVKLMIDNGN